MGSRPASGGVFSERLGTERKTAVIEILSTNDLVLLSRIEAILADADIHGMIADRHMAMTEGSLGFLTCRVLVAQEDVARARRLLIEAGLAGELRDG